jgi:hypothetical protein
VRFISFPDDRAGVSDANLITLKVQHHPTNDTLLPVHFTFLSNLGLAFPIGNSELAFPVRLVPSCLRVIGIILAADLRIKLGPSRFPWRFLLRPIARLLLTAPDAFVLGVD